MIYEIFHWTEYRYSESISLSEHTLHLRPRDLPGQRVLSSSLEFAPEPMALQEHHDYFGNRITSEVFRCRGGVCQDFAHLEIGCLRALGLPARYVSGYLQTAPLPGQPRFFGGDASHAWVSVFRPARDWFDLDPTNDHVAGAGYLTLAWGRDYGDVSLIRGTLSGGGKHSLFLSVTGMWPRL
jgi:transglutaminase-like putative cysteine protease